MNPDRFPVAFQFTMRPDCDGQPYHVTPGDAGGATAWGVTQATYDAYRASRGLPSRSVGNMEVEERGSIYRDMYWQPVRGDDLPAGVSLSVFDFGVTAGPRTSAKLLQRAVGVDEDGVIGPATLAAIADQEPAVLVGRLATAQGDYYSSLAAFDRFGRGWLARTEARRQAALQALAP